MLINFKVECQKSFWKKVKSQVEQFSEHPGKTASLLIVLHVDVVQPNPRHTIVFHLIDHIFNLCISRPILGLHIGIDQKSHFVQRNPKGLNFFPGRSHVLHIIGGTNCDEIEI